jgi:hypothetical protein
MQDRGYFMDKAGLGNVGLACLGWNG